MLTSHRLQREIACIVVYVECKYDCPIVQEWARDFENRQSADVTLRELNFLLELAENEPYELALFDLYKLHKELGKEWVYDTIPTLELPPDKQQENYPF